MGCLHLLVEHLLECHCRTERYVVVVAILRVLGKGVGEGEFTPRIHQGWMLISRNSRYNTRLAWASSIPSCELVVPSSRLHESWVTSR